MRAMAGVERAPRVAVATAGFLVLGGVLALGLWTWNVWVVEGLERLDFTSPSGLVLFGLLAGAGAFFSPCAFAPFPAYVSYQLALLSTEGVNRLGRVGRAAILTFGSFAFAMAALMIGTALIAGLSGNALLVGLRTSAPWIVRAAGLVLIVVGIYEGYFFVKAGM